jgi:hypothetical protein
MSIIFQYYSSSLCCTILYFSETNIDDVPQRDLFDSQSMDFHLDQYVSQSGMWRSHSKESCYTTETDILQHVSDNSTADDRDLSFEEVLDMLDHVTDSLEPTFMQTEEHINKV